MMRGIKIYILISVLSFLMLYLLVDTEIKTGSVPLGTEATAEAEAESSPVSKIAANALMSLCIAYTFNLLIIIMKKREKPVSDDQLLCGSCSSFVIEKAETEYLGRSQKLRPL